MKAEKWDYLQWQLKREEGFNNILNKQINKISNIL